MHTLIRDFLIRDGYCVAWKITGEEGLLALKNDKFRLVLLDVMLPGFDGYETLRMIRKDMGIPVLMMPHGCLNRVQSQLNRFYQ